MRAFIFLLAAGFALPAQGAEAVPTYRYAGTPIQISYSCAEDDFAGPAATCTRQNPCEVYLEVSDAESNGPRIFVSGNFHTDSATLGSLLLVSEDGGLAWRSAADRVPAAMLEKVEFSGDKNGWVAGAIVQPSTRDPFFLLTTDGGVSWRHRSITPDARTGFIEAYTFESPEAGYVWLDRQRGAENGMRYEMYETLTGGESWMLREVSDREIPRRRSMRVQPEPNWRVRSSENSFVVENRTASGWKNVAAFSVSAGMCIPPEPKEEAEPPPPSLVVEPEPSEEFRIPTALPKQGSRKPPTLKKD